MCIVLLFFFLRATRLLFAMPSESEGGLLPRLALLLRSRAVRITVCAFALAAQGRVTGAKGPGATEALALPQEDLGGAPLGPTDPQGDLGKREHAAHPGGLYQGRVPPEQGLVQPRIADPLLAADPHLEGGQAAELAGQALVSLAHRIGGRELVEQPQAGPQSRQGEGSGQGDEQAKSQDPPA